ncbi:MAG: hypothetical protein OIF55_08425 [Amphritea sp.]|nr:hypothetical protein [Amphritea sp.]
MCDHNSGWAADKVDSISERLGLQKTEIDGDLTGRDNIFAERYKRVSENFTLNIYALNYSSALQPYKINLPDQSYQKRGRFNALGKDVLMNQCLSDVTLYLGREGERIRNNMRHLLDDILQQAQPSPDKPVYLLSESLGSKVLRDTLYCKETDGNKTTLSAAERINTLQQSKTIFLVSNQLPLLNFSDGASGCTVHPQLMALYSLESDGLQNQVKGDLSDIFRLFRKPSKAVKGPDIVAFTDPNDLLSYPIDPTDYNDLDVMNVFVSNANTWLTLVENPLTAHTGYLDNEDVLDLISCGNSSSGQCQ